MKDEMAQIMEEKLEEQARQAEEKLEEQSRQAAEVMESKLEAQAAEMRKQAAEIPARACLEGVPMVTPVSSNMLHSGVGSDLHGGI